jgi:hypothetical protein
LGTIGRDPSVFKSNRWLHVDFVSFFFHDVKVYYVDSSKPIVDLPAVFNLNQSFLKIRSVYPLLHSNIVFSVNWYFYVIVVIFLMTFLMNKFTNTTISTSSQVIHSWAHIAHIAHCCEGLKFGWKVV